ERYEVEPDGVELTLETEQGAWPGAFRRGRLAGTSFQLLAYLVEGHGMYPLDDAFHRVSSGGNLTGLEYFTFALLETLLADHAVRALTVAPWPWGASYCLSVRHDVD